MTVSQRKPRAHGSAPAKPAGGMGGNLALAKARWQAARQSLHVAEEEVARAMTALTQALDDCETAGATYALTLMFSENLLGETALRAMLDQDRASMVAAEAEGGAPHPLQP